MRGFAIFVAMAGLAFSAPAFAKSANLQLVDRYLAMVKEGKYRLAEAQTMAPKIIWQSQNHPNGNETLAGAYTVYLTVSEALVGPLKSVKCQDASDGGVSCVFKRLRMFGSGDVELTERYFVNDGKIVKIINVIPPELLALKKNG